MIGADLRTNGHWVDDGQLTPTGRPTLLVIYEKNRSFRRVVFLRVCSALFLSVYLFAVGSYRFLGNG
jgi:hypothetical protein